MMKKKPTHRYRELVVNNGGALKGGRAGGVNYWGRDRLDQGHTGQHREYRQYSVITANEATFQNYTFYKIF